MSSDPYTLSRSELVDKHHQLEREGRYQENTFAMLLNSCSMSTLSRLNANIGSRLTRYY